MHAARVGSDGETDAEERVLVEAAHRAMRRNGFNGVTVADILAEAGLSTRAFYRHFASKDELLLAMYRRDGEAVAARIASRCESAPTAAAGLAAWLDEVLSLAYDPRRARRAAVLGSRAARRAAAYPDAQAAAVATLVGPLVAVLERGRADGSFPLARPDVDAHTINAVVWSLVIDRLHGRPAPSRQDALSHALRFILPAIGADA
jgi:AcrR family transcriptional regulator